MRKLFMSVLMALSLTTAAAQEMTWSPTATRFALWAPTADAVKVNIYADGLEGKALQTIELKQDNGMWVAKAAGNLKGQFYTFQVQHNGKWLEENPGPGAKAVGVNGQRGAIIDLRDTNPKGWADDRSPAFTGQKDAILYEMHHRDFSIDAESGIKNKGKFLALTEQGTKNAAGLATGIDHLKELGVTHVHLLPSYDFGSIDELTGNAYGGGGRVTSTYNWGYDPVNYNCPEGSYSTNAKDPEVRIREFKEMVMALHKAGIRVVMDVVYNHVFDLGKSSFERTVPGYYFRWKDKDGKPVSTADPKTSTAGLTPANGSGCGNETASDNKGYRDFMVNSIEYWMKEYHVDGFRFDLMAIHDVETMNSIRQAAQAIDPNVVIYGEGWAAEGPAFPAEAQASKVNTAKLGGIAAFGDEMRDGLRGGWTSDKEGAFLIGNNGNEESVKFGIVGAIAHPGVDMQKVNYSKEAWASEPSQMISYVSCHDDMCLADRLKTTLENKQKGKKDLMPQRIRLQKLAETAILTSQGVPFIWCGDEIMRDKKGVHNSFSSPDSINQIPWANKTQYKEVFDYVKSLIAIRKAHPAFRMGCADMVRENLSFLPVAKKQSNVIAWQMNGKAAGDSWGKIIVILNSNLKAITQQIPDGIYTVVCADGKADINGLGTIKGKKVVVPAQSAMIIYQ